MRAISGGLGVVVSLCAVAYFTGAHALAQTTAAPLTTDEAAPLAWSSAGARSASVADPSERTFLAALRTNLRFTADLSSRVGVDNRGGVFFENVVGLDVHKVISGAHGDWGTVILQGYLTRIDNQASHPPFFDGPHDTELVYRIANLNITRYGRGRFNIRVGHFEIPFGLEQVINTNGTLRDFMHGANLGLKADWGAGVNGSSPHVEYEVTLSRGTGNSISGHGSPYALAGRVGTPSDANFVIGASAFQGRVWNPGAVRQWSIDIRSDSSYGKDLDPLLEGTVTTGLIERRRVGVDVQWYRGLYGVLAEAAYGHDSGPSGWGRRDVLNTLVEINRGSSDGRVNAYVQGRLFTREPVQERNRTLASALGVRLAVNAHWALSAEYATSLLSPSGTWGSTTRSQIRYRF